MFHPLLVSVQVLCRGMPCVSSVVEKRPGLSDVPVSLDATEDCFTSGSSFLLSGDWGAFQP